MTDIAARVLQAERDGARVRALEEAAKIAETFYPNDIGSLEPQPTLQTAIAAAIRSLK